MTGNSVRISERQRQVLLLLYGEHMTTGEEEAVQGVPSPRVSPLHRKALQSVRAVWPRLTDPRVDR